MVGLFQEKIRRAKRLENNTPARSSRANHGAHRHDIINTRRLARRGPVVLHLRNGEETVSPVDGPQAAKRQYITLHVHRQSCQAVRGDKDAIDLPASVESSESQAGPFLSTHNQSILFLGFDCENSPQRYPRSAAMHSPLERIDEHQSESAWENYPSHRRSSPVLGRSSPDSLSSDSTGWTNASTLRTQPPSLFDERKIQPQITSFQSISDDASTIAALPQSPWGVHWKSPTLMVSLFTLGVSFCVAHHLFYGYLDGTAVGSSESQQWAIRAGTALALLAKAFLAASVGVALTQRLWMTLRAKPFSVQGLDNAFSLPTDPTSLFSGEIMGHAKLLWLMAAAMW